MLKKYSNLFSAIVIVVVATIFIAATAGVNWTNSAGITINTVRISAAGQMYQPEFCGYTETVQNLLVNGTDSTVTCDYNLGNVMKHTAVAAETWVASNVPQGTGKCITWTLILTNGGAYTQTWYTGTKWPNGIPPTLTAAGTDVLTFTSTESTVIRGLVSGYDFK